MIFFKGKQEERFSEVCTDFKRKKEKKIKICASVMVFAKKSYPLHLAVVI
jgi:hypothetical protein